MKLFSRGTLLIPSGPSHDPARKHLHIIGTDPDAEGKQLIFPVCKAVGELYDRTCTLQPHEHPFLHMESFVHYGFAQIVPHQDLRTGVERYIFIPRVDLNGQTVLKVCRGITASRRTPLRIKSYYLTRSGKLKRAA